MNFYYFLIILKKINGFIRQKVLALTLNLPIKSKVNLTSMALVSICCFQACISFQDFYTIKNILI
jgi:hypothetical protein